MYSTVHRRTHYTSQIVKMSAPLSLEAGGAEEAPNQGAIGGRSLNQTESFSSRFYFIYLCIYLVCLL